MKACPKVAEVQQRLSAETWPSNQLVASAQDLSSTSRILKDPSKSQNQELRRKTKNQLSTEFGVRRPSKFFFEGSSARTRTLWLGDMSQLSKSTQFQLVFFPEDGTMTWFEGKSKDLLQIISRCCSCSCKNLLATKLTKSLTKLLTPPQVELM